MHEVLRRGALTFALRLAAAGDLRGRWVGCRTVEDMPRRSALHLLDRSRCLRSASIRSCSCGSGCSRGAETEGFVEHLHADIAELKQAVEELRAAADGHRTQLIDARTQLQSAQASHDDVAASLRSDHAAAIAEMERWREESVGLAEELAAVRGTLSWRVTAPLRAVRRGSR